MRDGEGFPVVVLHMIHFKTFPDFHFETMKRLLISLGLGRVLHALAVRDLNRQTWKRMTPLTINWDTMTKAVCFDIPNRTPAGLLLRLNGWLTDVDRRIAEGIKA